MRQHVDFVLRLTFTPFCLNAPCQYTPPLNLNPPIFGLTSFGWLRPVTLIPTYSVTSSGNSIFYLRLLDLSPLFLAHEKA